MLGLEVPTRDVDALFDSWDPDGSGSLEMSELQKQLRGGGTSQLNAVLQPGAAGDIALQASNKVALRKSKINKSDSTLLQGFDIDEGSDKSVAEQAR